MKPLIVLTIFIVLVGASVEPVSAQGRDSKDAKLELSSYQIERGLAFAKKLLADQNSSNSMKQVASDSSTKIEQLPDVELQNIQSEIDAIRDKLKQVHDEIRVEASLQKTKKDLALLEASFAYDEPKIRIYLAALCSQGRAQPLKNLSFELTISVGPMSLQALRDAGALEKTPEGLLNLGNIACSLKNDRGRHAFPKNVGGSLDGEELLFLAPAQELLLKYQNLLVAKGLLAP
ncbi:MAG: hypothetical protein SGI77_04470 [Pirellulaceae bacterium]|nr:hypothetical protein [Pirellulaceae bacterium]